VQNPRSVPWGKVKVTENLNALLRFRPRSFARLLWIDSICTNQEDLNERDDQVKLMGEVFKRASRLFTWIGEED
jgi:Heterokaryon incompatibility protein (HET)